VARQRTSSVLKTACLPPTHRTPLLPQGGVLHRGCPRQPELIWLCYHRHGQGDANWARDGAQTKEFLHHLIVISFDKPVFDHSPPAIMQYTRVWSSFRCYTRNGAQGLPRTWAADSTPSTECQLGSSAGTT